MKNKLLHIFFLLVILFSGYAGYGQGRQLQFTHLDIKDGLSNNQVNSILKDEQGFIWFGTSAGLNRYDGYSFKIFRHELHDSSSLKDSYIKGLYNLPEGKIWVSTRSGGNVYNPHTESFVVNTDAYLHALSLPEGSIHSILQDSRNRYWFLYENKGIYAFTGEKSHPQRLHYIPNDSKSISSNQIADIATDRFGHMWVVHNNGILEKVDLQNLTVTYRNDSLLMMNHGLNGKYRMLVDQQGDLWIYILSSAKGLFYFDTKNKKFLHITNKKGRFQLDNNVVYDVVQDSKGTIWVGTDHGGINLINKKSGKVRYIKHNPEDNKSLSQNSIYSLYKDNSGIIWAGTYKKGVCFYNEDFTQFPLYGHNPNLPEGKSLPFEDVNCFAEDKKGNLWIGTNGGGLIYYNRKRNIFKQYKHDSDNPNSLSKDVIVSLFIDSKNKLWIGTYMGGLDCYENGIFTHYKHIPGDSTSLSNNSIWDIVEDEKGRLWLATLGGGLERFERYSQSFVHYMSHRVGGEFVIDLAMDSKNNLCIGTSVGLEVMNLKTEEITYYNHAQGDTTTLSNDNVKTIFQDSRGWLWVGTRQGLNLFDPVKKTFSTFTIKDGLPNNIILTILEDNQNRLWISTPGGLSCLRMSKNGNAPSFSFKNYKESDGLQGREFNIKSAFKTSDGKLIFGGSNGFNMFDPKKIKAEKEIPPLVFVNLRIFNRKVKIGETFKRHVILPKSISHMKSLTIPYAANDFSIVFSALGYTDLGDKKYKYKLAGFNNQWVLAGDGMHKATYTNLDPGEYTFLVKTAHSDALGNNNPKALSIEILPPFWLTTWAYIIYAIIIIGILYVGRNILLYRTRMNFRMEHQKHEAQRMHELDMMKIRFFTNVSHEFRTPLTLILAPIEKMIENEKDKIHQNKLKLIHRNAKRLLHLVNQLLDFRKLEVQQIKLHPVRRDIVLFVKEVVHSFTDMADKKEIDFSLRTTVEALYTDFDPEKIERILFNLLSNAFKFSSEKGRIVVDLRLETDQDNKDKKFFIISVKDNGIGIPYEKQKRIFDRFFRHRIPASIVNSGSGIGLAITNEFVKLHKGTIEVDSSPGKGSCFSVYLPITSLIRITQSEVASDLTLNEEDSGKKPTIRLKNKPTILLIDDNEDFRFYLKDNLSVYYNIVEASNGKKGWEKIIDVMPDLVVCDVMMPVMTGLALAKKIRKDPRSAGIPIILLTARATEQQKIEGFESGINDYITKPFNFEILLSRIQNLLSEKKRQKRKQPSKVAIEPKKIDMAPENENFLKKVSHIVDNNIGNPDFSVTDLSASLYMSRVTLHKKLSAISGKSPGAFIRLMRMKRAAQLLGNVGMNVTQTAYEVGYNNPRYFTKHFKQEFGILPSEYGKKNNQYSRS